MKRNEAKYSYLDNDEYDSDDTSNHSSDEDTSNHSSDDDTSNHSTEYEIYRNDVNEPQVQFNSEDIVIQNVYVCSTKNKSSLHNLSYYAGEFGFNDNYDRNEDDTIERIYHSNLYMIKNTLLHHQRYDNFVTTLITSEFFFFTNKPLSLAGFSNLITQLLNMVNDFTINFHLVLGSFAVFTDDGSRVMNIVPVLICGKDQPQIYFILKTKSSGIDPKYNKQYINSKYFDPESKVNILINGKSYSPSFDNVIEFTTRGGKKGRLIIEVCLDHHIGYFDEIGGTGKIHFNKNVNSYIKNAVNRRCKSKNNDFPIISPHIHHILVSNTIGIYKRHALSRITHCDPKYTPLKFLNKTTHKVKLKTFGWNYKIYFDKPRLCEQISGEEKKLVGFYHKLINMLNQQSLQNINVFELFNNYFSDLYHALHWSIKYKHTLLTHEIIRSLTQPIIVDVYAETNYIKNIAIKMDICTHRIFKAKYNRLIGLTSNKKIIQLKNETIYFFEKAFKFWLSLYFEERIHKKKYPTIFEMIIEESSQIEKYLINHIYFVNTQDALGNTPLHWAIYTDNKKLFKLLLELGADPFIENCKQENVVALQKSLKSKHFKALLQDYLNVRLIDAIETQNDSQVIKLLQAGASSNYIVCTKSLTTALIYAVSIGAKVSIIKYLLNYNNELDKALMSCVCNSRKPNMLQILNILINRGADVNLTLPTNNTLLHIAIKNPHYDIIKTLLKNGANPYSKNDQDISPYDIAKIKKLDLYINLFKKYANKEIKNTRSFDK